MASNGQDHDNNNTHPKTNRSDEHDWRDLPATPSYLASLFRQYNLAPEAWQPAQKIAGMIPTGRDWLRFADILMAGMGTIFLLAGILFFFAFNWDDLSKWQRFGIVEGAVVISTILAFVLNINRWSGRLALGSATILMGVALAVISQEYQTGANSYRLFQVWLMLITGWVLISRWNIMYLIWMILLNITVALYWEQIIGRDWQNLNLLLLVVNAGFVFVWETLAHNTAIKFMKEGRWFLYVVMVIALIHATTLMGDYVLETRVIENPNLLIPTAYFGLLGLTLFFYIVIHQDLLMLTFSALSTLVIGVIWSGRWLWDLIGETGGSLGYFSLMTLITVSLTALLVIQLRALNNRWERQS
ncbi:MAG: DUF2157 domain-containing protein [Anaerolineae bacterium]